MTRLTRRIEQEFELVEIAISSTLADPELYDLMAARGYDRARLQQGSQLCNNARALFQHQQREYGDLRGANKALESARQQIWGSYMSHLETARIAFRRDLTIRKKLGLTNKRKYTHAGWLEQARLFYSSALSEPAILRTLNGLAISQEEMEENQRRIATLLEDNAARWRRKGTARDATIARDQAIAELTTWLRDFLRLARVACKGRPQLLNKLGLTPHARDRASRTSTTPPAPTATLAAPEGQPLSAELRNGRTATANREA